MTSELFIEINSKKMSTFSDKSNYKSDKNDDKKTLIGIPKFRYKDNFIKGHFL